MMKKSLTLGIVVLFFLLLAACSPSGGSEPAASAPDTAVETANNTETIMEEKAEEMAESHDDAMSEEGVSEEGASEEGASEEEASEEAAMEDKEGETAVSTEVNDDLGMQQKPNWQVIPLTDVRSGQTFTLADFAGKTVFVETMATWCSNCRRQLGNVATARDQMADENTIFVALSVETNISNQELADYTEQTGFDWTFAVASPELLQELVATFGQSITNPPSTPHFIIRPNGSHTELVTGIESPDALISQLQEAGG